ncbi:MocR-like pyridoxine biosynthesis transcription factor PdxR [Halobacillus mangrovi]|uniref:GntR family transcriptional regulator n=1 Tax=Halobacillus mangrovi TaxID=402384 RepID=A0A1W5ZSG5_9BACI|nr:PLP-dependent aminotransferase family protein [Halobacillus mangrovi]ARI76201.1 GntR family transcriptional regulator [Halobacillus mangrovi]
MGSFLINFKLNKEQPLYEQLYLHIRKKIESGDLLPDTKLPSKRELSRESSLSQNTIEMAYGQLVTEGYIEALARRGYFVKDIQHEFNKKQASHSKVKEKKVNDESALYDFFHSGIDTASFPYETYRKVVHDTLKKEDENLLKLGHPQGEFDLREEIAAYIKETRGVDCLPSQIILGSGTHYLLKLLFQMLPDCTYAVEDPGYHRKYALAYLPDKQVRLVPVDSQGMSLDDLEKSDADICILTPSHHFPNGTVMPVSRRAEVLKWVQAKEHRYLIEDDYDSEFRYSGQPIPSLYSLDYSDNTIYLGNFSKGLMPSLRISYMVLPGKLLQTYQEKLFFYAQTVSRIDQAVLKEFIQKGHLQKHIQKMKTIYRKKRDTLLSAISQCFPEDVEVIGQDSGLHVLLRIPNGMTEKELIEKALEFDVKVHPISYYGKHDNQTVLIGYGSLSEKEIQTAVHLLSKAWF